MSQDKGQKSQMRPVNITQASLSATSRTVSFAFLARRGCRKARQQGRSVAATPPLRQHKSYFSCWSFNSGLPRSPRSSFDWVAILYSTPEARLVLHNTFCPTFALSIQQVAFPVLVSRPDHAFFQPSPSPHGGHALYTVHAHSALDGSRLRRLSRRASARKAGRKRGLQIGYYSNWSSLVLSGAANGLMIDTKRRLRLEYQILRGSASLVSFLFRALQGETLWLLGGNSKRPEAFGFPYVRQGQIFWRRSTWAGNDFGMQPRRKKTAQNALCSDHVA